MVTGIDQIWCGSARLGSVRFAVFWFGAVSFVSKSNTVIF